MADTMRLRLVVWRQPGPNRQGKFESYDVEDVTKDMSFLEMLDVLNEQLLAKGTEPIAFDNDCREGICGSCGFMIDGVAHGPDPAITVCQLHMRRFKDGDTLVLEPWRSRAFPVVKDLVVDRGAFDRIMASGGYISFNTGGAPDANALPVAKHLADEAFDAAACIGCGACVAQCKNASAMLFTSAKVNHLGLLPQGEAERESAGAEDGRHPRRPGLRELLQRGRVRGGVPQGDPHPLHPPDEPGVLPGRLPQGEVGPPVRARQPADAEASASATASTRTSGSTIRPTAA